MVFVRSEREFALRSFVLGASLAVAP